MTRDEFSRSLVERARRLTESELAGVEKNLSAVRRRGRILSFKRVAVTGILSVAVLLLGISVGLLGPSLVDSHTATREQAPLSGAATTAGYTFSEIRIIDGSTDAGGGADLRATIFYKVAWADGSSYPGKKRCQLYLVDSSGREVGRTSFELMSLEAAPRLVETTVSVVGDPTGASIECEETRLDSTVPRLSISNVRLDFAETEEEQAILGDRWVDVLFHYEWIGDGDPAPQGCQVIIYDGDGAVLQETSISMASASNEGPRTGQFKVSLSESVNKAPPQSADVNCTPRG